MVARGRAHSISVCVLLAVPLLVAAQLSAAQTPTVDEIVTNHLNAKGGADKLRAIKSVKTSGKVSGPSGTAPVLSWAKRPNMMRREITVEGQAIVVGFDGTTVWAINPMMGSGSKPQEVTGPQAEMTKQDADEFDSVLLDYKEKGHKVELIGAETIDGVKLYHLMVTKKNGNVRHIYLNAETWLEARILMPVERGGIKGEVAVDFANYKQVEGITVPLSIRQSFGGQPVAELTVEKVEFNVPIEDSFFKMPGK
jgi:outer membrane lipoprotein-sorting protein